MASSLTSIHMTQSLLPMVLEDGTGPVAVFAEKIWFLSQAVILNPI